MTESTKYPVRRANFTRLLNERGRGAQKALADKLGVSESYIGHLKSDPVLTGHRPIHEDTARKIEAAWGLTPGELDRDSMKNHRPGYTPRPPGAPLNEALLEDAVRAVLSASAKLTADKTAGIVRLVYEHATLNGSVSQTYVEQLIRLMR